MEEPEYFEEARNLEDLWKQTFPVGTKMRKSTKRKAPSHDPDVSNKENSTEPIQNQSAAGERDPNTNHAESRGEPAKKEVKDVDPSKPVKPRAKRAAGSKQKEEPEYFEEARNLEDLWKQTFPVGTEWELLDSVYQYPWDFRNLEEAIEEEDGVLHGKGVYLFGCTEPQWLSFRDEMKLIVIPVVVAVVSPFPPSDKLGINSVQSPTEEIVPMKQMKMGWVPYIPLEKRLSQVERLKSNIFILDCTQRRAALKHLKEDRFKKFTYCLPYFHQPLQEEEIEDETEVIILYPDTEPPTFCSYDWQFDEPEEFTDKLIEKDELPSDKKEQFMEFVKAEVREAKKANRKAREARKKALEEMSEETKAASKEMKFYKFYPKTTPETPDVSTVKSLYINRYFGKAHAYL